MAKRAPKKVWIGCMFAWDDELCGSALVPHVCSSPEGHRSPHHCIWCDKEISVAAAKPTTREAPLYFAEAKTA
jgi:hypothetical protein